MATTPAYRYHIHSDVPGKFSLPTKHSTRPHASGARDIAVEVRSIDDLAALFRRWSRGGERVQHLDFHVHGSPQGGAIYLGNDILSWQSIDVRLIENTGVQRVFKTNCHIAFLGCDVADEANGEAFLAVIGKALLPISGGTVKGNTSWGLQDPFGWLSSTHAWHPPTGTWVTATVAPGGSVTLSNHVWLYPNRLREVAAKLEPLIRSTPEKSPAVPLPPPGAIGRILLDTRHQKIDAGMQWSLAALIDEVWRLLGRNRDDDPTHADMATACLILRAISDQLRP